MASDKFIYNNTSEQETYSMESTQESSSLSVQTSVEGEQYSADTKVQNDALSVQASDAGNEYDFSAVAETDKLNVSESEEGDEYELDLTIYNDEMYLRGFLKSPSRYKFSLIIENDSFDGIYNSTLIAGSEDVFKIRSGADERNVSMHISPQIDLIAPDPTGLPYDPVFGLYYDGAVIKWNGDTSNTNGVLVMVEWSGDHTDDDYPDSFVINADIVPDNGECVLDNRLFQGIPHGAIIKLSILRANIADVENFEFAEGLFTDVTFAVVSQCLRAHIVLIREMP